MSLIDDVKYEISKINYSRESILKFRITFVVLFFAILILLNYSDLKQLDFRSIQYFYLPNSMLLVLVIIFIITPNVILSLVYKIWMVFSLTLGWVVSRIILTILFFIVLTPTSIIAKIFNKKFFDPEGFKTSAWLKHKNNSDYTKMY
jgi:hypothetical protein